MNVVIKHPATRPDPSASPEPEGCVDLAGVRIPHVSIHSFFETQEFSTLWHQAEHDRRLIAVTSELRPGGLAAAVDLYRDERSPDLIIIETREEGDDLCLQLDSLADRCRPETQVIVVGRRNDIQLYRRLLEMGVSAYLVAPVDLASIIAAIAEIYHQPGAERIGRIAAVLGAKGGVGTSTVAQSLALALSKRCGSDVLLVDLDIAFGTAAPHLDFQQNHGLAELIRDPARIDAEMLDRLCMRRARNLALLGTQSGLDSGHAIDDVAIDRVLEVAQSHFGQIVLDVPHLWAPWVERALISADDVIVVSTPELASLHNAGALIGRIRELRPNDRASKLVLNQVGMPRRQEISAHEVAQVLEIKPALSIPFDAKAFSMAAARSRMVAEVARRSMAQACAGLADLVGRDAHVERGRVESGGRPLRWLPRSRDPRRGN